MTGRFIALEGPDGVGKTALAARIGDVGYEAVIGKHARADDHAELVFVARRQVSGTSAYAAKIMTSLATTLWHSGDSTDLPDSFWVGVQSAWFTAHATNVLQPVLDLGYDIIVDGWIYKLLSKLLVQGYRRGELEQVFRRIPAPDAVVLLIADPAAIYDRRQAQFRPAELGMHARYGELNRDTFIDYQQRSIDQLVAMATEYSWRTVALEASGDIDDAAALLRPIIDDLRSGPGLTTMPPLSALLEADSR